MERFQTALPPVFSPPSPSAMASSGVKVQLLSSFFDGAAEEVPQDPSSEVDTHALGEFFPFHLLDVKQLKAVIHGKFPGGLSYTNRVKMTAFMKKTVEERGQALRDAGVHAYLY